MLFPLKSLPPMTMPATERAKAPREKHASKGEGTGGGSETRPAFQKFASMRSMKLRGSPYQTAELGVFCER